jgi:hypothetical protein
MTIPAKEELEQLQKRFTVEETLAKIMVRLRERGKDGIQQRHRQKEEEPDQQLARVSNIIKGELANIPIEIQFSICEPFAQQFLEIAETYAIDAVKAKQYYDSVYQEMGESSDAYMRANFARDAFFGGFGGYYVEDEIIWLLAFKEYRDDILRNGTPTPQPTNQHTTTEHQERKYIQDDMAKFIAKWMRENPLHEGNANQYAKRAVGLFTITAKKQQSKAENLAPRIRHFHNPKNSITPFDESEYSNFLKIWGEEK